jgi:hypothetical protein
VDKRICSIIVWSYLGFVGLLSRAANPYGAAFLHTVVPALLVLTSLQWFLLLKKLGWQIAGVFAALFASSLVELSRFAGQSPRHLLPLLLGALVILAVVLSFLAPDGQTRGIFVIVTATVGFVISIGLYLSSLEAGFRFPRTGPFLFWSPLVAMATWISGVAFGWKKSSQVLFICLVAQPGIGLFDMGTSLRETWMYAFAVVFVLIALGFVIAWADNLNK